MSATERIELRIDPASKKRLLRFSKMHKVSSSQFIKTAIEYYIRYIEVTESDTITLTREELARLSTVINEDAVPNDRLKQAASAYNTYAKRQPKSTKHDHNQAKSKHT